MHKYRITWKRKEDIIEGIKFTTIFMKDFPSSTDEVQRIFDVARLIKQLPRYNGLTILKIEEVE